MILKDTCGNTWILLLKTLLLWLKTKTSLASLTNQYNTNLFNTPIVQQWLQNMFLTPYQYIYCQKYCQSVLFIYYFSGTQKMKNDRKLKKVYKTGFSYFSF